jgi:hypothetical protein
MKILLDLTEKLFVPVIVKPRLPPMIMIMSNLSNPLELLRPLSHQKVRFLLKTFVFKHQSEIY